MDLLYRRYSASPFSLINQYLENQITEQEGIDIIKKEIMSKINDKNV